MNTRKKNAVAVKAPARTQTGTAGKVERKTAAAGRPRAVEAPTKSSAKPALRKTPPSTRKTTAKAQLKLVTPSAETQNRHAAAERLPEAASEKVRIFQIYYRPEQRQFLDPNFEPYNNEGDKSPLLEFNVFRKLVDSSLVREAGLWGALSWKFREKTGLSGEQLRQIIAANPGHDVYYCNPFPELEALYHNLWVQGETSHPNFLILCHDFFEAAGLSKETLTQMLPSSSFAASNYFVATPRFWRGYTDFVAQVINQAEKGMSSTAKAMIYSSAADRKAVHAGASYMPFIVERLFDLYVIRTQGNYKVYKFACDQQEANLNVHLKLLRQMKDVAIGSKSLWMATCWLNYRNLYFSQSHGSAWCKAFLKSVTPNRIDFGK